MVTGAAAMLTACAAAPSAPQQSFQAIRLCLGESKARTGRALAGDADRAYVYARGGSWWIYFTRGDSGTFGYRSDDYRILLTCGVTGTSGLTVVFLGETMQDPIIDLPKRPNFVTPEGSTELMFRRDNGAFQYCCSQPFDRHNVGRSAT
ncbi:MAG TPA: hypothetical protein VF200_07595 [Woeseiaceae bacterium]